MARVKSVYLLNEGELHVNYSLKMNQSGSWKVYDINIDGISLLRNYRSDFRSHIERSGMDSLIEELESLEKLKRETSEKIKEAAEFARSLRQ